MTISKKYRSYGLRRSNNLSDVEDKREALSNILNDLQIQEGRSFIAEDLDAIKGIKDTLIDSSVLTQLLFSAPKETVSNTSGSFEFFKSPLLRAQDKINLYRAITGKDGTIGSGMGPTAWLIPSSRINTASKGSLISNIVQNFDSDKTGLIKEDDFWSLGEFSISDKFDSSFPNIQGGVLWEGFFTPSSVSYLTSGVFETNGLAQVEIDENKDGNWKILTSIYSSNRKVFVSSNVSNSALLPLASEDFRYIAVNDKLKSNTAIKVAMVNSNNSITLTNPVSYIANSELEFTHVLGTDRVIGRYELNKLYDLGERVKLRLLWWYPSGTTVSKKYFKSTYVNNFMPFNLFSNTDISVSSNHKLKTLLIDAVTYYQEKYGDKGAYKTLKSNRMIRSSYIPPISDLTKININPTSTIPISFKSGTKYITSSQSLANTSPGNFLIDASAVSFSLIPKGTVIKQAFGDIKNSDSRLVNYQFTSNVSSVESYILNHNGLIDYFIANSSDGINIRVDSTAKLRKGMICISPAFTFTGYATITSIANSTSFSASLPVVGSSNTANYLFVYSNSGLIDETRENYCIGVVGKDLTVTAILNANTITVSSNTDLYANMKVQYSGGIEPDSNTRIVSITGNAIRMSKSTTAEIEAGKTIVFAPPSSGGDKQSCILPTNLAPPFLGIERGLSTNGKSITSSNSLPTFTLNVRDLNGNNTPVFTANTSYYNAKIRINDRFMIKAIKI